MAGRGARHTLDNKSYQQKLKPVSVYYYHIKYVLTLINYIFLKHYRAKHVSVTVEGVFRVGTEL